MAQERVQFARNQKYPQRYIDILTQNDAHSDDEYNATHKCYIVKKLPFRSANANNFFERLDQEMEKNDQFEKRRSQRRVRRRPRKAVISTICRPPKLMPIDFFDAEWFNELSTAQKFKVADSYRVALLPKAKQSFCSVSAKDEQISDKAFCSKYWDQLSGFYDLTHVMGSDHSQSEDEDDSQDSDYGSSVDLEQTSGSEDEEEEEGEEGYEEDAEKNPDYQYNGEEDEDEDVFYDDQVVRVDAHGDSHMFEEQDDARDARQDALAHTGDDWNEWQWISLTIRLGA